MPRNTGTVRHLHEMAAEERLAVDGRYQEHWYRHVAPLCAGASVLDVGAGSGYGLDILREAGCRATGIDPLPLLADIEPTAIEEIPDGAADAVLAIDVLEHVEEDAAMLAHLLRCARRFVFLSTPNWAVSRCANPHHVREYTAAELRELLGIYVHRAEWWTSDAQRAIKRGPDETANNFGVLIPI